MGLAVPFRKNKSKPVGWHDTADMGQLVRRCCTLRSPAAAVFLEQRRFYRALFASSSTDSVKMDLILERDEEADLRPASLCCVCFAHADRSHVFLSSLLEYEIEHESYLARCILGMPSQVASESRMAFRVPMLDSSRLRVKVTTEDGRRWEPRPIDLSMTGILLEFASDADPDLAVGSVVGVDLSFDQEVITLRGEVRGRREQRYGLFFPEVLSKGTALAPKALQTMVHTLEREWLAHRIE